MAWKVCHLLKGPLYIPLGWKRAGHTPVGVENNTRDVAVASDVALHGDEPQHP